jgi:hypothetical protein
MNQQKADPAYIKKVLAYLYKPGQVIELRALSDKIYSGYFDNHDMLASEAVKLSGNVTGVYVTANPCKPELLHRAKNRVRVAKKEDATGDKYILLLHRFLLDFDPERAPGISSTNEEHKTAIERARKAKAWLEGDLGFSKLLLADSSNGAHLMANINLPNTRENADLLRKCIEAVALRFEDEKVKIDRTVYNPARIWKLYGTLACKGDDTPERPWREAKVISTAETFGLTDVTLLQKLYSLAPEDPKRDQRSGPNYQSFNIDDWLIRHGIEVANVRSWNGGEIRVLRSCPWNSDHTNLSAYIIVQSSGALAAGCHHDGCAGKGWHELRDVVEPGWSERRSNNGSWSNNDSRAKQESTDAESQREEKTKPSPWARIKDAPTFLAEEDKAITGVAKDLIMPGAVTTIAAPRGLCKTLIIHGVAYAMATGGLFRGERVEPIRVLLVDRDNPERVVKERLRGWGAANAPSFHLLTRTDAPDLKDRAAWEKFPVGNYDVVIIDSIGSFTEGITEREGKETTQVLATVLDLIHRGPAVVLLANCTKDALSVKGRGEWSDRVDIIYEGRDATGFTPSGKKPWFQELPAAGEDAWADRSARRKNRTDYRLAFIPSKFRLGAEPEPFCLEVNVPRDEPWTLTDVTTDIVKGGDDAIEAIKAKEEKRMEDAAKVLAGVVKDRAEAGDPILKTDAENFLHEEGVTRAQARTILETRNGSLWQYPNQGHPKPLSPVLRTSQNGNGKSWASPPPERVSGTIGLAAHAQSERQGHPPSNPASELAAPVSMPLPPKGVTNPEQRLNGGLKEADIYTAEGWQEEERYAREERAGIEDDDGFEDLPK